ncbi:MAG TPA: hypothetical protein VIT65_13820 [Microlunatus sp.]
MNAQLPEYDDSFRRKMAERIDWPLYQAAYGMPLDAPHLHPEMRKDSPSYDARVLVSGWLKRIRYKPDTSISMYSRFGTGQVVLHVLRKLPDSTTGITSLAEYADIGHFVQVGCELYVPELFRSEGDFGGFYRWLHQELRKLEDHETDEWFRVDGGLPFDPHIDMKRRP